MSADAFAPMFGASRGGGPRTVIPDGLALTAAQRGALRARDHTVRLRLQLLFSQAQQVAVMLGEQPFRACVTPGSRAIAANCYEEFLLAGQASTDGQLSAAQLYEQLYIRLDMILGDPNAVEAAALMLLSCCAGDALGPDERLQLRNAALCWPRAVVTLVPQEHRLTFENEFLHEFLCSLPLRNTTALTYLGDCVGLTVSEVGARLRT